MLVEEFRKNLNVTGGSRSGRSTTDDDLKEIRAQGTGLVSGAHALRLALASLLNDFPDAGDLNDPLEILFIDLRNAFNLVHRHVILRAVKEFCPGLLKYVHLLYGGDNPALRWFHAKIWSKTGVQQGDPLGSLLFSLALVFSTRRIKEFVPDLTLSAWFVDDGSLVGRRSNLIKAFWVLCDNGSKLGFYPNSGKCARFGLGGHFQLPLSQDELDSLDCFVDQWNSIPCVSDPGDPRVELLGAPLNSGVRLSYSHEAFLSPKVSAILSKLDSLCVLLVDHPHALTAILRNILGVAGIRDLIATCPPHLIQSQLMAIDNKIRDCVNNIIGTLDIGDWSSGLAQLPCDLAGLGLGSAVIEAPAAYVGTVLATKRLRTALLGEVKTEFPFFEISCCNLQTRLPAVELDLFEDEETPRAVSLGAILNDCPTSVRSRLTRLLYEGKFSSFFEAASNREKLLLRVGREVGARAAVGCVPSSYFKTTIPADRFKRLLCRCLDLPIFPFNSVSIPPKCSHCDDILDPFGDHSVS